MLKRVDGLGFTLNPKPINEMVENQKMKQVQLLFSFYLRGFLGLVLLFLFFV